jgi:hypothetical protein
MRKDVMKLLLLGALKQSGSYNPEDTLHYIEESLQPDELRYITGFLEWIRKDTEMRSVGPGNWEKRLAQYELYRLKRSSKKRPAIKKKTRAIKTEQDLDAAVDTLPESEVRTIVKQIATLWFVEEDATLNLDKELGSDHLEAVTQALTSRGIRPTE